MRKYRTKEEYDNVIKMLGENKSVKEISELTGILQKTINGWVKGKIPGGFGSEFRIKLEQMKTEEVQEIIDASSSISNMVSNLGKPGNTYFYTRILGEFIMKNKFDFSKMKENLKIARRNQHTKKLVFDTNSTSNRGSIKKYLLKNGTLENKCSECGIKDTYNGKPIVMDLDHINGINNDNRIENLRMLCPNCHSQQDTSCGKNIKRKKVKITKYCSCGNEKHATSLVCIQCDLKNRKRKFEVSKEELETLIKENPMTTIGKMFGVSDNAVKKRCEKLGIELKPARGRWTKKKYGKE